MPPAFVKKGGQVVHYYYSKLVIAPSSGLSGNFGFIVDRYKALERGEIGMSDYDRELWLKETETQTTCAYCGAPGKLVADHLIPLAISGPDSVHNIVRACEDCNASKSDRDLIEWWDATHSARLGAASESLPRIPAGIYLKFAYDWLKINNRLELPAKNLEDLKPFQSSSGGTRSSSGMQPPRKSRQTGRPPAPASARTDGASPVPRSEAASLPRLSLVELLLESYLYKEQVQEVARELGIKAVGTKEDLIARIRRTQEFDGTTLLRFLDKSQLRQACEDASLPDDGFLRSTLESRLSAALLTERRTLGTGQR